MRKTTVYLSDEEAAELRRVSAVTGKSQSELIREGVRRICGEAPKRAFHSMGKGRGPGGPTPVTWDADALYDEVMGQR
ncbi:MAG: ribbon-helix-helix domain-containing protein [Egibacteraceae bacterium]